ncbi:MAG TPA: amidohydrolase [Candidatus Cybelea sp.]
MVSDPGPADLIVVGAAVHTLEGDAAAEAVAIRGDRFVFVGSADEAMALHGPATEVLDAAGATLLPGLIDAHLHLTSLGFDLQRARLECLNSYEELVASVAAFARGSTDAWILGGGWDQNRWPGKAFPTHAALTAAIPDRPVALSRVDRHAVLVNARAMAVAGIDRSTPEPAGGRILRDAYGDPTGVFVDAAAALIHAKIPRPAHDELVRATRAAIRECNRWGVTAVAEPGIDDAALAAHEELIERGEYTIRNHAMLADDAELLAAHLRRGMVDGAYGGRLWVRAIKMYADGALGSRGAALLAPYSDDPATSGFILTPQAHIEGVTQRGLRAGFQVCTHAIGDRANRMVLDAYESALRSAPAGDLRLRIEHAQVLDPQDVPRFARLGVIASVQSAQHASDLAWTTARLGAERLPRAYAWRSLLDSGATVANGTDAPVEPVSPSRTFHAAISRADGRCMTRREALASMTIWAARANFQDGVVGSIALGKYADFVILDRDWMSVPPEEILPTKVLATYFGGRRVYAAERRSAALRRPAR